MRAFAFAAAVAFAATAYAQIPGNIRQEYYRPPVKWMPADTIRDTLPDVCLAVNAHLRVRVPSHRRLDITLVYNRIDSANYRSCRLLREAGPVDDRLMALPLTVTLSEVAGGIAAPIHSATIQGGLDPASDDYSLKLASNRSGSYVTVGQKEALWTREVPFRVHGAGEMLWFCGSESELLRCSLGVEKAEPYSFARFASTEELDAYLAASTDVCEGYWIYFDRDTDPRVFSVGGDYRLATVKASDNNGYEIIYLGGARTNATAWSEMRIKGYLRPTGFIGHYDLEWIDPSGAVHKRETSADIVDGSSLTLYFPLYAGKVRYRRVSKAD